ncbi:cullin-4A [Trichonephila clavipes]|nr:cullin-4A [Trichonephila clavipes]
MEEEERLETPDHPHSVLQQYWDETELNCSVTCMVLKDTANDRRHLALCHDEFRGPCDLAFSNQNCNGDSHAGYEIPEEAVSKIIHLEFAYYLKPRKVYDLKVSDIRNYSFSEKGLDGVLKKVRRWV